MEEKKAQRQQIDTIEENSSENKNDLVDIRFYAGLSLFDFTLFFLIQIDFSEMFEA